mgnify:CR=1 FL=1|jgi:prepilin-type N-terminal cleavage/methylation domain-containing protein
MRRGLSLLEVLVVLALLGLLAGLFLTGYTRLQDQAKLTEAARSLALGLQQARAEARAANEPRCVKVFPSGSGPGGYAIGTSCSLLRTPSRTLRGVELSTETGNAVEVEYRGPYGEAIRGLGSSFHLSLKERTRTVSVVGPLGRTVVR